jgi:hypothetical protein
MKLFTGWVVSAGLVLMAVPANAQGAAPQDAGGARSVAVSDFSAPYAAMPPDAPAPGNAPLPGYGPRLLPPQEVYTVLRESGYSPLGMPRLRGPFYTIAVIDRRGNDGRLVIDARSGQIVRFVPAYRIGENYSGDAATPYVTTPYAPAGRLPPISNVSGPPRPPASVPRVASRTPPTIPMPKAAPSRPDADKPVVEKPAPQPSQQSAAVQVKPADAPAAAPPAVEAKPAAPPIQPTQEMPKVQGLE